MISRRPCHTLLVLACTLATFAMLPAAAAAVVVGIADQNSAMFSDSRFVALQVHQARITVPWDVATARRQRRELHRVQVWLSAAAKDGVAPLVSFGGDGNRVPSVSQYTGAVRAFVHKFPSVKQYTAWNEPDWVYRPALAKHPSVAASYFNAMVRTCHGCTVVAGDVYLPAAQLRPWLRAYVRGLRYRPAAWALHNYYDVRTHSTAQLRTLEGLTHGPIWLDEISGVEKRGHWQYHNQSARAAARDEQFLFSLPKRFHRVARIYHYEWQGQARAGWDSGLIAPNGSTRPAYNVVLKAAIG